MERTPEEIERILRNQVWHYPHDTRTDWDDDGCEGRRLIMEKGSRPMQEGRDE